MKRRKQLHQMEEREETEIIRRLTRVLQSPYARVGGNLVKIGFLHQPLACVDLTPFASALIHAHGSEESSNWKERTWKILTLRNAPLDWYALRLNHLSHLIHIDLGECSLLGDDAAFEIGRECKRIKSLDASGWSYLTDRGLEALASGCSLMETIQVDHCPNITDEGIAACFINWKELKNASFQDNEGIRGSGFLTLPNALNATVMLILHHSLRDLSLAGCKNLTDTSVRWIAESLPNLEKLSLSRCIGLTNASLEHLLPLSNQLVSLDLRQCCGVGGSIGKLLGQFRKLERLDIVAIGKIGVQEINFIWSQCKLLVCFSFGRRSICTATSTKGKRKACTASDFIAMNALLLESICFTGLPFVTDSLLRTRLCTLRSLIDLDISGCQCVTQDGLSALVRATCRTLRFLDISFCIGVKSFEGWASLPELMLHSVGLSGLCFVTDQNLDSVVRSVSTQTLRITHNPNIVELHPCCQGLRTLDVSQGCPRLDWSRVARNCPLLESFPGAPTTTAVALERFKMEDQAASMIQKRFRAFSSAKWVSFRYVLHRFRKVTPVAATKFQALWRQYRVLGHREVLRRLISFQRGLKRMFWVKHFSSNLNAFRRLWNAATKIQASLRGFLWRREHGEILLHLIQEKNKRTMFSPMLPTLVEKTQQRGLFNLALIQGYHPPPAMNRKQPLVEIDLLLGSAKEAIRLKSKVLEELKQVLIAREEARQRALEEALRMRAAMFNVSATRLQKWTRTRLRVLASKRDDAVKQSRKALLGEFFQHLDADVVLNTRFQQAITKFQARVRGMIERVWPKASLENDKKNIPRLNAQLFKTFDRQANLLSDSSALVRELKHLKVLREHYHNSSHAFEQAKFEFYSTMESAGRVRHTACERFHTNYVRRKASHEETACKVEADVDLLYRIWQFAEQLWEQFSKRQAKLHEGLHNYEHARDGKLRAIAAHHNKFLAETMKIELGWVNECLEKRLDPLRSQAKRVYEGFIKGEARRMCMELSLQEKLVQLFADTAASLHKERQTRKEVLSTRLWLARPNDKGKQLDMLLQLRRLQEQLSGYQKESRDLSEQFLGLCSVKRLRVDFVPPKEKRSLEKKLKRLHKELRFEAWTALIPTEFFKPEEVSSMESLLQAARNRVVNDELVKEFLYEQDVEEHERRVLEEAILAQKKLEGGKVNLMQEMFLEARNTKEDSSGTSKVVGIVKEKLQKLLGSEARTEKNRIMQAILTRQRQAIGAQDGICDIAITVGKEETERMHRRSMEDRQKGLPFFRCLLTDARRAFELPHEVFFWTKASVNAKDHIRIIRVNSDVPLPVPESESDTSVGRKQSSARRTGMDVTALSTKVKESMANRPAVFNMLMSHKAKEEEWREIRHPKLKHFSLQVSTEGSNGDSITDLKVVFSQKEEDTLIRKGYEKLDQEIRGPKEKMERVRDQFFLWTLRQRQGRRRLEPLEKLRRIKREYEEMLQENPNNERVRQLMVEVDLDINEHEYNNTGGGEGDKIEGVIDFLGLTKKDMARLTSCFAAMDTEHNGQVTLDQFLYYVGVPGNEMVGKIFQFLDTSQDGSMDFEELLHSLGTFCMFGSREVVQLVFQLVDVEGTGEISLEQLFQLFRSLHEIDPEDHRDLKRVMQYVKDNFARVLTFEQLFGLHCRYPLMLLPVFSLQEAMMKNFLGLRWWERKKRLFKEARAELERANEKEKREVNRKNFYRTMKSNSL